MDEQSLKLLLLPGVDGTGELFGDFVKMLPGWIKPHIVRYPRDQRLLYDQLFADSWVCSFILRAFRDPGGVILDAFGCEIRRRRS